MKSRFKIALLTAYRDAYLKYPHPPIGLLSIASYLIKKQVADKKNIIILEPCLRDPIDYLKDFKPDIVGISALTLAYPEAVRLAQEIKRKFKAKIVVGGIHISAQPESFVKPFDIGVMGEGEETFLELIKVLDKNINPLVDELKKIKGIVFRDVSGRLVINPRRELIEPLDKILPLDWSLLPKTYFRYGAIRVDHKWQALKVASIFTSRGCPFNCIFCGRSILWDKVRFFQPKLIADEIEVLVKKYQVQAIRFLDDTFNANPKSRIKELISELKRRKILGKIIFYFIYSRTDLFDEEMARLFKEMGVKEVFFGFESGSERMLAFLKRDTTTVAINKKAVALLDRLGGIGVTGSVLLGSPTETDKDLRQTVEFIRWLKERKSLNDFAPSATTPLPGVPLWKDALEKGIVSSNMNWKELLWDQKHPKLFFKDSLTPVNFFKSWRTIEKWRSLHRQKLRKELGWEKARETVEKENKKLLVNYGFDFFLQSFQVGRSGFTVRRVWRKIPAHLTSFKRLSEDMGRVKAFTRAWLGFVDKN